MGSIYFVNASFQSPRHRLKLIFSLPTIIIIEIILPKYTHRSSFLETLVSIRSLDVT